MVVKQITSILLGGGLVSALNLIVFFAAINLIGSNSFSQVVIVLALFFGCIDLFNSGSSKILIKEEFLAFKEKVIAIDFSLSIASFTIFILSLKFLTVFIGIEVSFNTKHYLFILIFFIVYTTTQFHLGFLRYKGLNHVVSFLLLTIPISRFLLIFLYFKFKNLEDFIIVWLFVEILPSVFYLAFSKDLKKKVVIKLSWKKFIYLYKQYFISNWLSNCIYSLSKHFDVIIFSYLFSINFAVYYKMGKSVYNIAFNLGGSMVVYVFKNVEFEIYNSNKFIILSLMTTFIAFVTSFFLVITVNNSEYLVSLSDFNFRNLILYLCLGYILFFPTIFTRLMHYKIQIIRPSIFTYMSLIDVCILLLVMFTVYVIPNSNEFLASIYIPPLFAFFSLLFFVVITRKIANDNHS